MKEKYLNRRWNDVFSLVILIAAAVFVTMVVTGLVENGFTSFTILVVIGSVG